MAKKILYVEDAEVYQALLRDTLREHEVISALTAEAAVKLFDEHRGEFALIALDGRLSADHFGHQVARHFKNQGYTGPMVAASSDSELNGYMQRDGCQYVCGKKEELHQMIRSLVGPD